MNGQREAERKRDLDKLRRKRQRESKRKTEGPIDRLAERDRNKDRQMEQRDIQTNIHIQIDGETGMFRKGEMGIEIKGRKT